MRTVLIRTLRNGDGTMMTEEKAERIIHDTIKKWDKIGRRPTRILVHPDYHLCVSTPATKAGLDIIINMDPFAPLDKFYFQ